jgi:transcription-repair coupling factor (superfamily II helicase)
LLKLYAERARTPGYAYSTDTVWQKEFEADFPYEETPDQQQTIADVKADMERPQPMDRLVCGDVGFGKTEVAIRAAFKAVQDGKQVAVLVPTTVLAQQHARTFKERFARYPVCIEVLSRFSSPRQQKAVVGDLSRGLVDIIIGTHRLLSADVLFKNLGLLVVDEEQRFGVGHKEMIKLLRTNVDALTLTATPIPRTLQMSLGGARDLSMIETPPQDRLPVQTYVLEFQPEVVQDAIMREIQRDGQVFYVHNRVQTISRTAAFLKKLVPQASFRVAHGQMREDELEQVMWDFLNHRFDCLICTTIIENGLDLSNVNTLIVENADQFGLAQLYQLRGRVGRSNRLAYSYFTFSRDKVLSEQAEKRLRALQEFTEFGSGFKLALRDLEIRGAGNLLGPEQHGHMAAVGFDLYNQLLQEAVQELKGEKPATTEKYNPAWELPVDTYIPDTYISDPRLKVDVYRRLAMTEDIDGVQDLALDVRDRFGPLPEPVDYLFTLHKLRVQARTLMIGDVQHAGKNLVVHFGSQVKLEQLDLGRWGQIFGKRISFSAVNGLEVRINTGGLAPRQLVKMLTQVLAPDGQVTPRECL